MFMFCTAPCVYFTFVYHAARKRHLSAARRNALAGGMLYKGSASLTPRSPSGKASASRTEDPRFQSLLRRNFFGVESFQ